MERHIDLGPTVVGRVVAVTGLVSEWPIDQIDLGEAVACHVVALVVAARLRPCVLDARLRSSH